MKNIKNDLFNAAFIGLCCGGLAGSQPCLNLLGFILPGFSALALLSTAQC